MLNINSSLVLVKPRKTCLFITERLLMGGKESNQTKHAYKTAESPSSKLNEVKLLLFSVYFYPLN